MNLFKLFGEIAVNSTVADETIDNTMKKVEGLRGSLQDVETQSESTGKGFGKGSALNAGAVALGNMYSKFMGFTANIGKRLVKTGFGFDASMEAYRNQFEALLNDAGKAEKLVADLQTLAKVSPLGMEGLANNAVSLLNTGIELAEIIPMLETLGNLSLGDTNKMGSVVRAYTQILSKGQLMAQEMYQLGDAGVPIREIMTLYGGERYADGSWYESKMTDKKYKIPAEDMAKAFQAATAEGGKWHDYMFKMMDTWNGQVDRFGEEGKETVGALMNPFFEMAKSEALPRMSESLGIFGTWISKNQGTLEKMADTVGGLVAGGFDKMLDVFKWVTENGEAVGVGLGVIAAGLAAGAIAAHPYAAAVVAVAAGLAWLYSAIEEPPPNAFSAYTEDEIALLQQYHDACKAAQQAREEYNSAEGFDKAAKWEAVERANANVNDAFSRIDMQANGNEMLRTYNEWIAANEGAFALDIPASLKDGTENAIQSEINGMTLEGVVKLYADTSALPDAVYAIASGKGVSTNWNAEGAIFSEPTIFNTRLGLQGVGEAGAEAVAPISKLQQYVSDAVRGVVGGMQFNVVLDSGVLVGQLAPKLDAQLGTIASRKGRGN